MLGIVCRLQHWEFKQSQLHRSDETDKLSEHRPTDGAIIAIDLSLPDARYLHLDPTGTFMGATKVLATASATIRGGHRCIRLEPKLIVTGSQQCYVAAAARTL